MPRDTLTNIKPIFKRCVITAVQPAPNYTINDYRKWTEKRCGRFANDLDDNVTHLLCTAEQYRDRIPPVPQAIKRKKLWIVSYDWFDLATGGREKKLPEREFSLRSCSQTIAPRPLWRIHVDQYNFAYRINLLRYNHHDSGALERYELCLYESTAKPRLFVFAGKYLKRKGGAAKFIDQSATPRRLEPELNLFKAFFRKKTGIDWEDRIIYYKTTPADLFQYTPPTGGKPVGRRTLFSAEYCWELNTALRGLKGAEDGGPDINVDRGGDQGDDAVECGMEAGSGGDGDDVGCEQVDMEDGDTSEDGLSEDDIHDRDEFGSPNTVYTADGDMGAQKGVSYMRPEDLMHDSG